MTTNGFCIACLINFDLYYTNLQQQLLQGALDCKVKILQYCRQQLNSEMILYGQTFGNGGKEELSFNRNKPVRTSFRERQPSAITDWGKNGGRAYEKKHTSGK